MRFLSSFRLEMRSDDNDNEKKHGEKPFSAKRTANIATRLSISVFRGVRQGLRSSAMADRRNRKWMPPQRKKRKKRKVRLVLIGTIKMAVTLEPLIASLSRLICNGPLRLG